MIGIDVNNYHRDNDKNKHDKAMHYSSSDTDTSSTSSLISSSTSLFSFDDSHSKNHTTLQNNQNSFLNQVESNSDVKSCNKSALNNNKSGIFLKELDKKGIIEKTLKTINNDNDKIGNKTLNNNIDNQSLDVDSLVSNSLYKTNLEQRQTSESVFESNLENLSHYDNFDTDLQERKQKSDDFVFCDMTSANDLNFISPHRTDIKNSENIDPIIKKQLFTSENTELKKDEETNSEDTNFSFAEDVENFEQQVMQSPQVIKNRRKMDEVKFDFKEEDGVVRVRKINMKGHNVNFSDNLVTVYSCLLDPWKEVSKCSLDDLIVSYTQICSKNMTLPSQLVLSQLQEITDPTKKVDIFSLKDARLSSAGVDSLEELFKRIRIGSLNLQAAVQDEQASVVLFDLLSYYEPCDRLVISANKDIGVRGWQAFSQYLKQTTSLYSLEGRDLGIPEYSYSFFLKGIQFCTNLHTITLTNSVSSGRHLNLLVNAIRGNVSITKVSLGGNQLNPQDASLLCNLVRDHKPLEFLDVSDNNINDQGATHIFDILSSDLSSLSHLSLASNRLSKFSMSVLSRSLKHTRSLKSLVLDHNDLFNEGVGRLKEGLACNQSLHHLSLQTVGITCEGIASLSDFIATHPTLHRLNLLGNHIGVAGLTSLCRSIKSNHTLTCIDLDQTDLTDASDQSTNNLKNDISSDVLKDEEVSQNNNHDGVRGLLGEIEGYIERNKEEKRRIQNAAVIRKPLERQSSSDGEVGQHIRREQSNYDSLPTYNKISKVTAKSGNSLSFLLSLSLSSWSPLSSGSSALSSLSTSMSSLSSSPLPQTDAEISSRSLSNIHKTDGTDGKKNCTNNVDASSKNNINNNSVKSSDGLPSYAEAVKQMTNNSTVTIPVIKVNGVQQPMQQPMQQSSSPTKATLTVSAFKASTATTPTTISPTTSAISTTTSPPPTTSPTRTFSPTLSISPTPSNKSPVGMCNDVEVRVVSSPVSKKKFRVSRALDSPSCSPTRLPSRPSSLLSPKSLLSSPPSLSASSSSSSPSLSA